MKWPDSSKMMLGLERCVALSRSRSMARRRPKSRSSSFCRAVPVVCMSVRVGRDSS